MQLTALAMWLGYRAPGPVLAVMRGTEAVVLGFGETANGSGVEPDGRTLFRIGLVSKRLPGIGLRASRLTAEHASQPGRQGSCKT